MKREELIKHIQSILKTTHTFDKWNDEELGKLYVVLKVKGIKAE